MDAKQTSVQFEASTDYVEYRYYYMTVEIAFSISYSQFCSSY